MRKPAVWLGALFIVIFLGFLFYSTFRGGRYRCEVCMSFQGRKDCRTAAADTRDGRCGQPSRTPALCRWRHRHQQLHGDRAGFGAASR
jgi:hypothetical protein